MYQFHYFKNKDCFIPLVFNQSLYSELYINYHFVKYNKLVNCTHIVLKPYCLTLYYICNYKFTGGYFITKDLELFSETTSFTIMQFVFKGKNIAWFLQLVSYISEKMMGKMSLKEHLSKDFLIKSMNDLSNIRHTTLLLLNKA